MRIGIEAQRLLRPHKHGMDIVALELIRALQELDHENNYFIFVRPDVDEQCLNLHDNFTLVKVEGANYVHWEQVALPRAVRTYKLDVLHCTANTAPLLLNIPLILTLHDVLFLNPSQGINTATLYQKFGNKYRALLVRRLVSRCQVILTISKHAEQEIINALHIPQSQIKVLYNAVSDRFIAPVPETKLAEVQNKYKLPARYFFFLGSADPRKNMKNVLLAFVKYSRTDTDVCLLISGRLPDFLHRLLTPDEYAYIEQRCQFIGYIPDEDLPALYTLAEIFLFPSISEGFGLPILEAMACSTPVITSTLTAMPEVAGNAALLVDPYQPDNITDAIQQLANKPQLRQQLVKRGHEQITHFSWKKTAEQVLDVYKSFEPASQPSPSHFHTLA